MNKYNLEYIDKLRIHELRDFARKIGVSSPTTMKKEELIDKINSIVDSQNVDEVTDNHYVKKDNEVDFFGLLTCDNSNIISSLLATDSAKPKSIKTKQATEKKNNTMVMKKNTSFGTETPYSPLNKVVEFSFSLKQNAVEYEDKDVYYVQGYLDIHPNGYGILRKNGFIPDEDDTYLTLALVKKHNLKKGYYICGKAKHILVGKPKIMYEIEDIDNKKKIAQDFENMSYNGIGAEYYLDKFALKMCKGERSYICNMSIDDAVKLATDFVEENATSVKFVNVKARPEDNYKSNGKLDIINVPFFTSENNVVETIELVMERIKREMEYGKQNILMIYNFSELIRIFNIACEGRVDFDKINAQAVNKIYRLLYLSKYVEDNLNCSLICIDRNGTPRDLRSLMELELLPLFNSCYENISKQQ